MTFNGDLALLLIARTYKMAIILVFFAPFYMDGTGPSGVGSHAVYPLQDIETGFPEAFGRYSPGYGSEAPFTGLAGTSAIRGLIRDALVLP